MPLSFAVIFLFFALLAVLVIRENRFVKNLTMVRSDTSHFRLIARFLFVIICVLGMGLNPYFMFNHPDYLPGGIWNPEDWMAFALIVGWGAAPYVFLIGSSYTDFGKHHSLINFFIVLIIFVPALYLYIQIFSINNIRNESGFFYYIIPFLEFIGIAIINLMIFMCTIFKNAGN